MGIYKEFANVGEKVIVATDKVIVEVTSPSPVGQAVEILGGLAAMTFSQGDPVVLGIGLGFVANGLATGIRNEKR